MNDALHRVAALIARRNQLDAEIAALTHRPPVAGHLGEWVAAEIFDIELEESAVAAAIDGRFRSGPLADQSVNVKWYGKLEGLLDVSADSALDHYVVLAGPRAAAVSSRGSTRPLVIASAFVIDAHALLEDLARRNRKIGIASSVRREWWERSEVYPAARHPAFELSDAQRSMLALFGPGSQGI